MEWKILKYISSKFFESLIELNHTSGYNSGRTCSIEDIEEFPENVEIIDTGSSHRFVNQTKINPHTREIVSFYGHGRKKLNLTCNI